MKWYRDDLKKYVQAKEYVDTLLVPLQAFQLSKDSSLESLAFQSEVLTIYANEIEKELSGRLLLAPPFVYINPLSNEIEVKRINSWIDDAIKQPFNNVFLITFDNAWKKVEKEMNGNLIWLPAMKPTDIQSEEAVKLIRNQMEQISELIRSYW